MLNFGCPAASNAELWMPNRLPSISPATVLRMPNRLPSTLHSNNAQPPPQHPILKGRRLGILRTGISNGGVLYYSTVRVAHQR